MDIRWWGMVKWYEIFNRTPEALVRLLSLYVAGEERAEISPLIPLARGLPDSPLRRHVRQHLADEVLHARLLRERIHTLGGTPFPIPQALEPQEYFYQRNGNLKTWLDNDPEAHLTRARVIEVLLFSAVLEGSGTASFYAHAEATRVADPETYFLLMRILADEIRHATYTQEYAYRLAGDDLLDFTVQTHRSLQAHQGRYWATVMRLMLEHLIPREVTGMGRAEFAGWMALARAQEHTGVPTLWCFPAPQPAQLVRRPAPWGTGGQAASELLGERGLRASA